MPNPCRYAILPIFDSGKGWRGLEKNSTKRGKTSATQRVADPFQDLTASQKALLSDFFAEVDFHCLLPRREKTALKGDFERALSAYAEMGVSLEEALKRLAVENLGGFYARPPVLWYALDDAAKIYPLSMTRGGMSVFRLSARLTEQVRPELLQMALAFTVKRFPSFATTVKRGFFWHYLDTTKRRFLVEPENGLPCRPLKIGASGSQSFRVLYYGNRISVEFFHVLTDGTGGMAFLKTLVAEYLRLCGAQIPCVRGVRDVNAAPPAAETENAFLRVGNGSVGAGFLDRPAVQMSGDLTAQRPYRVLHFQMDAAALAAAARKCHVTVTAYLLAQMFLAGRYATDGNDGEMSIQVPVNMRKLYPSETVRNFALYCGIRLPLAGVTCADEILPKISQQLAQKTSPAAMDSMLLATQQLVRALRYVPLMVKEPVARMAYGFLGDRIFSNTLSNLGVVELPEEMAQHVESLDFVLGTSLTNRAGCALVTCGGVATLSISKLTADPSFEEKLYALLRGDGVAVRVEGSVCCEG